MSTEDTPRGVDAYAALRGRMGRLEEGLCDLERWIIQRFAVGQFGKEALVCEELVGSAGP